mmetsp:Transcript_3581/g.10299  ORF Transcript_3581/g.10299 Transcript_3581/m.10299 type:complete len:256 (-) Transcript_3581:413-1180(-)
MAGGSRPGRYLFHSAGCCPQCCQPGNDCHRPRPTSCILPTHPPKQWRHIRPRLVATHHSRKPCQSDRRPPEPVPWQPLPVWRRSKGRRPTSAGTPRRHIRHRGRAAAGLHRRGVLPPGRGTRSEGWRASDGHRDRSTLQLAAWPGHYHRKLRGRPPEILWEGAQSPNHGGAAATQRGRIHWHAAPGYPRAGWHDKRGRSDEGAVAAGGHSMGEAHRSRRLQRRADSGGGGTCNRGGRPPVPCPQSPAVERKHVSD